MENRLRDIYIKIDSLVYEMQFLDHATRQVQKMEEVKRDLASLLLDIQEKRV